MNRGVVLSRKMCGTSDNASFARIRGPMRRKWTARAELASVMSTLLSVILARAGSCYACRAGNAQGTQPELRQTGRWD